MALLKRQTISYEVFDDQSPFLMGSYVGDWTHTTYAGFNNDTITLTATPGASFSYTFTGTQAWLYGGLFNTSTNGQQILTYPTADYQIDGVSAGSQKAWIDNISGLVVYFQTPKLSGSTHKIDFTVTGCNSTTPFIIDFFLITPTAGGSDSGVATSRSAPAPSSTQTTIPIVTSQATPVGAIVGGVVGGIAGIAIVAILIWYFLRKRTSGGRAYYFEKPTPADMLAGEDRVEPFNATSAPSSPGFRGSVPQSAYSDSSSNQLLNQQSIGQAVASPDQSRFSLSGPSEAGMTYVSGSSSQPRVGKAALIAQHQDAQQPVQFQDSGIRFGSNGTQEEAGPSQLPSEVPPTYTPH